MTGMSPRSTVVSIVLGSSPTLSTNFPDRVPP
eukprot:CAMPEP_0183586790 /NCGR_PEP_ID=MMETSP0371-20130417/157795_1 /TAXON_ID=268820 /ORGANISM="Peridinium aciculiferum, Strain PAER-2" /LENGTH=31 /DNA_ID= /DNA_START= /DNA_END= /DNA_ORIENTATION=